MQMLGHRTDGNHWRRLISLWLRAVVMCEGNILKAAKLLKIGKTTVYRKLMQWGYSVQNRVLIEQPSALSGTNEAQTQDLHKSG